MAAVTEAISSLGPALLVRLDRLWLLVVGPDAAKREIQSQAKPHAWLGGNSSVVKRNRGLGCFFTGRHIAKEPRIGFSPFWSGSTWQGDSKANVGAKDNIPS